MQTDGAGLDLLALTPATQSTMARSRRWVIVMAGGNGVRLQPVIREWLGAERPKQYCAIVGTRSMIEHTWARALGVVARQRIVTIAAEPHEEYLRPPCGSSAPGPCLLLPESQGTFGTVYVGLAYVLAQDPAATVLIMPSDHFIQPEARFAMCADRALKLAEADPARPLILGAEPGDPSSDYGWIEADPAPAASMGWSRDGAPCGVRAFHEKPLPEAARRLFEAGALWSTMIVAANAKRLWDLGCGHHPEVLRQLGMLRTIMRRGLVSPLHVAKAFREICDGIAPRDFSQDLLTLIAQHCALLPLTGIEWSDWGCEKRIRETADRNGLALNLDRAPQVGRGLTRSI